MEQDILQFLVKKGILKVDDIESIFNLNLSRDGYVRTVKDLVDAIQEFVEIQKKENYNILCLNPHHNSDLSCFGRCTICNGNSEIKEF